jgi:MFS family permease
MATVADLFVERRGRAYGVVSASYNVGSGAAAGLAVGALWLGNWRSSFVLPACGLVLAGGILRRLLSASDARGWVRPRPVTSVRRVFVTTELRYLLALFCVNMVLWQGTIGFFPTLLQTDLGVRPTAATVAFAAIFGIGLIVSPVVGAIGDRVGHREIGLLTPVVGVVGLSVLLSVPTTAGTVVGTVLFALGLVTFWPVMTADLMDALSDETLGADYGITRAIFYAAGSLAPTYVGVAAERTSFRMAYAGLGACFLVSAAIFVRLAMLDGRPVDDG